MVDVTEVVRDTDFGRSLLRQGREQGREQGELESLVRVLTARFPVADRGRVEQTAQRLQTQLGAEATGAALVIEELDPAT